MILIPEWREVLRKAWSLRLMALAGLLSGLEVAMPYLDGILPIPTGLFAAASGLIVAAAFVSRLVAQSSLRQPTKKYEDEQWDA